MLPHSDESTTTKTVSFRRNHLGRWGLRAISLLRAVVDARTSTSVSRRDLTHKTHRRWSQYGWYRPPGVLLDNRNFRQLVSPKGKQLQGTGLLVPEPVSSEKAGMIYIDGIRGYR